MTLIALAALAYIVIGGFVGGFVHELYKDIDALDVAAGTLWPIMVPALTMIEIGLRVARGRRRVAAASDLPRAHVNR